MKHTPGPWETDVAGQPIIINGTPEGKSEIICIVEDNKCGSEEHYNEERAAANARLIAAAPELLEVLEAIGARINGEWDHPALMKLGPLSTDPLRDILCTAKAAIAKAKGLSS